MQKSHQQKSNRSPAWQASQEQMLMRLAGQAGSRRGPSVPLSRLRAGLGPGFVATSVGSHGGAWMIQLLGQIPLKFKLIIQVSAAVDTISKQLLGGWSNLVVSIINVQQDVFAWHGPDLRRNKTMFQSFTFCFQDALGFRVSTCFWLIFEPLNFVARILCSWHKQRATTLRPQLQTIV